MAHTKQRRPQLLSSTRPRKSKPPPSLSSHTTRTLIRTHHALRKQLSSALISGNDVGAKDLQGQIDALGGLAKYQQASIQGQSSQRGGDTSKMLVEWLSQSAMITTPSGKSREKLRLLEVGSLRTDNACSRSGLFHVTRIDLHSQHPEIKAQDFMDMPIPKAADLEQEGFDVVSLSLVVNFVSDAIERGKMLKRIEAFLRPLKPGRSGTFPALFLVLPVACVANSRYLDEERLEAIMGSLGYTKVNVKTSAKLTYYLWKREESSEVKCRPFKKEEVRAGKSRNNFAILLH